MGNFQVCILLKRQMHSNWAQSENYYEGFEKRIKKFQLVEKKSLKAAPSWKCTMVDLYLSLKRGYDESSCRFLRMSYFIIFQNLCMKKKPNGSTNKFLIQITLIERTFNVWQCLCVVLHLWLPYNLFIIFFALCLREFIS